MSGKHILAFEADPLYANMLSEALGNSGYQVDIVSEGVEGLDKAGAAPPDLIYLCVELPRISGFSICNKIKKNPALKGIPLIITSAEATPETFEKHKRLKGHADEYLHKPFSAEEIAAVVMELVTAEDSAGENDLEEIVIDDEDTMLLEADDEFDEIGELAEIEMVEETPKSVDSDINALADAAFDGLEIKEKNSDQSEDAEDDAESDTPEEEMPEASEPEPETPDDARLSEPPMEEGAASSDGDDGDRKNADNKRDDVAAQKLKKKNKELTQKIENLEKQLIAAKSVRKSSVSSSEFLDLREALNNKDRELLDLKDALNGKEKESLDLRDKINGLERQKADLEDKNIDVHKQLNQVEHQLESLGVEHEHLSQKAAEQERLIEELEEAKSDLEAELDSEKSGRAADVQKEKDDAAAAIEAQRTQMQTEADERLQHELSEKQAEHEAAVESLNAALTVEKEQALATMKEEHESAVDELNAAHTERENDLSGQLLSATENIARLEEEKADLESTLTETKDSLENTAKQLEITQQTLKETGESLEAEQKAHERTRQTLSHTDDQLAEQIARGDGLDKTVEELEAEVEDLSGILQRNTEISEKAQKAVAIAAQLLEDLESIAVEEVDEEDEEEGDVEEGDVEE